MSNEPDKINSGVLATTVVLVALATLAIALYVTSLVRAETSAVEARRSSAQDQTYRGLSAGQKAELSEPPSWIDKAKGLVSVPIERAMAWTLEAVRADPYALTPGSSGGLGGAGGAGPQRAYAQSADEEDGATPQVDGASSDSEAQGPVSEPKRSPAQAPQAQPDSTAQPNPTAQPKPAAQPAPAKEPKASPPAPAPGSPAPTPAE